MGEAARRQTLSMELPNPPAMLACRQEAMCETPSEQTCAFDVQNSTCLGLENRHSSGTMDPPGMNWRLPMRKIIVCVFTAITLVLALVATNRTSLAQPSQTGRSTIAQSLTPPAFPLSRVQDSLIEFPLPKGEDAYASIDGRKMHKYVEELTQISRRYRDNGHPQFWGRMCSSLSVALLSLQETTRILFVWPFSR